MLRQVLIVDGDAGRRARLRAALDGAQLLVEEAADGFEAAWRLRGRAPDLLLADAGEDGLDAGALRAVAHAPSAPPPALALVPGDRPGARLAALRAGFDEALGRDAPPRLIQARVRACFRTRDLLDGALRDAGDPALAPASSPAEARPASGPASGAADAAMGPRVAVLSPGAAPDPSFSLLARMPGCEVSVMPPGALLGPEGADLVAVDAAGTKGDLAEGAAVLALLADLRGRPGARDAATLLLLPPAAVETAALALDLGVDAVVPAPCPPDEAVHRARALLARKSLSDRLRLHIRARLQAATRDPLTGLHNRRHAEPALHRMAEDAGRARAGLAVLVLDIDHFKSINDRWGHAAGDRVLREVARRLRACLGPDDLLARTGGEEFLAALPGVTAEDARAAAEGIRRAAEGRPFALADDGPWRLSPAPQARVTLSVGVAHATGPEGAADLVERADRALYEAKRAGRNTVSVALGAA